jgi:hypothetical protein
VFKRRCFAARERQVRAIGFFSDEGGATVIEHAIVTCVLALVVVYAVGSGLSPAEMLCRIEVLTDTVSAREGDTKTKMVTRLHGPRHPNDRRSKWILDSD